jgi:hypothetical protein
MKRKNENNIIGTSNQESQIKEQLLPELCDPFVNIVFKYLQNKKLITFSTTCKHIHSLTKDEREKREASAILLSVMQGNEIKVKERLEINPGLLTSTLGEAKDYSGRDIKELTPFQAALCSGDVEMCEMMKTYFDKIKNGNEEIKKQSKAIFPEGIDAHVKKQQENVFDFNEIMKVIINANGDEATSALNKKFDKKLSLHQALEKFRTAFTEKSLSEIVFNPTHLLKAFEMYNTEFNNLNNWDKRDLFWRQVIGFVQRYLPACMLQAFAQGIYGIVEENEKLRRSFDFSYSGSSILPLEAEDRLGFDCAGGGLGGYERRGWGGSLQLFSKLCVSKNIKLGEITQPIQRSESNLVCN